MRLRDFQRFAQCYVIRTGRTKIGLMPVFLIFMLHSPGTKEGTNQNNPNMQKVSPFGKSSAFLCVYHIHKKGADKEHKLNYLYCKCFHFGRDPECQLFVIHIIFYCSQENYFYVHKIGMLPIIKSEKF